MEVEARLEELELVLPEPLKAPPGLHLPFSWVRVRGNRAYVSGHGAQNPTAHWRGPSAKWEPKSLWSKAMRPRG
jgi:hypothetical protein